MSLYTRNQITAAIVRMRATRVVAPAAVAIAVDAANVNANGNLHNPLIFKLTFLKRLRLIVIGDNAEATVKHKKKNERKNNVASIDSIALGTKKEIVHIESRYLWPFSVVSL